MKTSQTLFAALGVAALAAMVAFGCGGSSGGGGNNSTASSTATAGGTATGGTTAGPFHVTMTGNHAFSPANIPVPAGSTVIFANPDVVNHTVTTDTGFAGFSSDSRFPTGVPSGSSYSFTVPAGTAPGTVLYYHCRFHGNAGNGTSVGFGMAGSITVQ